MNTRQREFLRNLARTSICGEAVAADLLTPPALGTVKCSIELRELPTSNFTGKNIQLSVAGEIGTVRCCTRHSGDHYQMVRREWECTCDAKIVWREINRLERYGLWEVNDFSPAPSPENMFVDGCYIVVHGCDPSREFTVDAAMFTASASMSPFMRAFNRAAHRLLRRDRSYFERPPRPWQRLFDW